MPTGEFGSDAAEDGNDQSKGHYNGWTLFLANKLKERVPSPAYALSLVVQSLLTMTLSHDSTSDPWALLCLLTRFFYQGKHRNHAAEGFGLMHGKSFVHGNPSRRSEAVVGMKQLF